MNYTKLFYHLIFIILFWTQGASLVYAFTGGEGATNGGDTCENRIREIANDIASWIEKGGAENMVFENVTLEYYTKSMLREIHQAKVSCTNQKLKVGKAEKTCINYTDQKQTSRIVCNFKRFQDTDESEQYFLIHHEYAGLSGLEQNLGDEESDYNLSNQITGFLEDQVIKRLVVKKLDLGKYGFKKNPRIYFGEPPAKYTCYTDGTFMHGKIIKCTLPSLKEIDRIKREFLAGVELRQRALKDVEDTYRSYGQRLLDIAEASNGNEKFEKLYQGLAYDTEKQMDAEFADFFLYTRNLPIRARLDLWRVVGENSPFLAQLELLREMLSTGNQEEKELKYHKMIRTKYTDFMSSVLQVQGVGRFVQKTLVEDRNSFALRKTNRTSFFDSINYSESCSKVFSEEDSDGIKKIMSVANTPDIYDYVYGFNAFEDIEVIKQILQGPNGKPLKINCIKVKEEMEGRRTVENIVGYDKEKHQLDIKYNNSWFIMQDGVLFSSVVDYAHAPVIREFLKNHLE